MHIVMMVWCGRVSHHTTGNVIKKNREKSGKFPGFPAVNSRFKISGNLQSQQWRFYTSVIYTRENICIHETKMFSH